MGQTATPSDPLASQRTELLGRVAAAQLGLEKHIAALRALGVPFAPGLEAQLSGLLSMRVEIATANAAALPGLQEAVAALEASADAAAQTVGAAASDRADATVSDLAEASHRAADAAMAYTKSLSLRFTSDEDERAYHERETERRAYMAAQQAKRTPEGDLNASGAAVGQMADARAHGAQGPAFDQRWNDLVETTAKLRDAVRQSGGSTQEFDDRLRADLRRIMKAKGLSDAEIDARFAATPDPLEAAKAFVRSEGDVQQVDRSVQLESRRMQEAPTSPADFKVGTTSVADDMAELRGAGLALADHPADAAFDHGVAALRSPGRSATRTPS